MARPRLWQALTRVGRMLAPHATGESPRVAGGILLGIAVVGLHILRPWPLKWILDFLTGARYPAAVVDWVATTPTVGILALSGSFLVLALAEAAAEYGQVMVLHGLGNRILYRFRAGIFNHIVRQPLSFHESRDVGELLTRVVYDTSRLRRGLNGILIQIIQTVALFLAILGVLLWHQPLLGAALGVGGIVALLVMRRGGWRIARAAKKQRQREGNLAARVAEELRTIRELQTFGLAGSGLLARFGRRNGGSLRQEQKVRRLAARLSFRVDTILAVTIALALGLGAEEFVGGRLTAGDLVLFASYAMALRAPFTAFANQTARLGRTAACGDRLAKIVERAPEIVDGPYQLTGPLRGELSFDAVSIKAPKAARGARKWTLHELTCQLPAGKRIAVVGPNGAGKSTLLRLALRLADPDRGRLLLDGRDLREYPVDAVRRQMSVVFQDAVLTGLTVGENIAFGAADATPAEIEAAAAAAHAQDFIRSLPLGYQTPVRRGGDLFSGGERRRLAIARAVLRDGRIWLLDEPTAGLDHRTAEELVEVLLDLTENRTTLWVTHDPELASRLDWVLSIDQGRVAFNGPSQAHRAWLSTSGALIE